MKRAGVLPRLSSKLSSLKTPPGSQSKLPLLVHSSDVSLEAGLLEVSCQSK